MKPIAIIVGTRPEIIKMSPVIFYCIEHSIEYYLIHSNQHYSKELDLIFFEQLQIPSPTYSLEVGSGSHGKQTGKMLQRMEKIFVEHPPSFVLVQGDTNTTFAGALSAKKLNISVGHIEAGLRSNDRKMPEEINRIMIDHISNICFVPTKVQQEILLKEGIDDSSILITGNTIVDALYRNIKLINNKILDELQLKEKKYFLATIHRAENVDDKHRFIEIIETLGEAGYKHKFPVLVPLHPRSLKALKKYELKIPDNVIIIKPQGYFEFLALLNNCRLIMTDSGGIQEEACILGIPCVTIRNNTERPETVDVGGNIIAGVTKSRILTAVETMLKAKISWQNPFGDGTSSKKIINKILEDTR